MASTGRRRVNSNSNRTELHTYVDGSTARQVHVRRKPAEQHRTPASAHGYIGDRPGRVQSGRRKRTDERAVSQQQLEKNRARARNMGWGYVAFLTAACLLTMFLCITYLNLKAVITIQNDTIAEQESKLNALKADNDAYYNQVLASVTLEDIKNAALSYGMHYASESQIQYYSIGESSYLRQYQDITE